MNNFMISKEDGDRLLEQYLVDLTKSNGSKRCAEESYAILEKPLDCQLLLSVIIRGAIEAQVGTAKNVEEFEAGLLSALTTVFCCVDKKDIPKQLQGFFQEEEDSDDVVFERVCKSKKLKYAVSHFVNAYMHYDYFEARYPEISKSL